MDNITSALMKKYYESGRLGNLSMKSHPRYDLVKINLSKLFKHITGEEAFKYELLPEDIESVVVYGSMLYRHFKRREEIKGKKYLWFGPEVVKEVREIVPQIGCLSILVVTKNEITDNIKTVSANSGAQTFVDTAGPDILFSRIEKNDLSLFINYLSTGRFLDGTAPYKTMHDAVRYGIPIIGQERFKEIISGISSPKREPLHGIAFKEDLEGKLQGSIY